MNHPHQFSNHSYLHFSLQSESEEVAVDSFGRVILQKESADFRRDNSDGDIDRRKRDRDGDIRDRDSNRGAKMDFEHDKKDNYSDRDARFSGGPPRMDRGLDRGSDRGPDRGHDRGPDRGPDRGDRGADRGPDRGHPSHLQRGPPPPNFNNRGGAAGGRGFNDRLWIISLEQLSSLHFKAAHNNVSLHFFVFCFRDLHQIICSF